MTYEYYIKDNYLYRRELDHSRDSQSADSYIFEKGRWVISQYTDEEFLEHVKYSPDTTSVSENRARDIIQVHTLKENKIW